MTTSLSQYKVRTVKILYKKKPCTALAYQKVGDLSLNILDTSNVWEKGEALYCLDFVKFYMHVKISNLIKLEYTTS